MKGPDNPRTMRRSTGSPPGASSGQNEDRDVSWSFPMQQHDDQHVPSIRLRAVVSSPGDDPANHDHSPNPRPSDVISVQSPLSRERLLAIIETALDLLSDDEGMLAE